MRKLIFTLTMAVMTIMLQAADYPYLVFTNTSGTTTVMSVGSLKMTVSGTELQVTNSDASSTFVLTELQDMQFSTIGEVSTQLENVLNADEAVEVYSLSGKSLGKFDNLLQATSSLQSGVYVITDGKNSTKVIIDK